MCCSRTEMTVELRRMSGLSVDPSLAWGNGGGAGSMRARPSHRRTDYQPSREKRLGFMLRRPSWGPTYSHLRRNFFCKIGSASASKTPQRSRSGVYLTFSTTESTAFTGCTEGTARIPSGRQRPATSGRNQCGFVYKKKEAPNQVRGLRPKGAVDEKVSCWRSANHAGSRSGLPDPDRRRSPGLPAIPRWCSSKLAPERAGRRVRAALPARESIPAQPYRRRTAEPSDSNS